MVVNNAINAMFGGQAGFTPLNSIPLFPSTPAREVAPAFPEEPELKPDPEPEPKSNKKQEFVPQPKDEGVYWAKRAGLHYYEIVRQWIKDEGGGRWFQAQHTAHAPCSVHRLVARRPTLARQGMTASCAQ